MPICLVSPLGTAGGLLGPERGVVGHLDGAIERRLVVARVDAQPADVRGRLAERRVQVLPPELDGVHADPARERIDDPLHDERRLRPAGAPIRVGRRRVRHDARVLVPIGADVEGTHVHPPAELGDPRRQQLEVGAHVRELDELHPEDAAVLGPGERAVVEHASAMDRRHVVLRPRLDPLHRTVELAAQRERERLLGVDVELRSEAAAHVRRDDPQLVLRDPGRDREADPRDVRDLRRRGERELARRRASVRQAPTGLHRVRDQTRLRVPLLDDHRGGVEDALIAGAAVDPVHDVVRAEILMDHDPVGRRLLEVEDSGERGRSNRDRLRRILGLLASLRDDDRHRVAGEPDLVGRSAGSASGS